MSKRSELDMVSETRLLMGMVVRLKLIVTDQQEGQEALEKTFARMVQQAQLFNRYDCTSPLSRLNQQGFLENPPAEFCALLRRALEFSYLTGGAFDITVKPLLDRYASGCAVTAADLSLVDYRQVKLEDNLVRLGRSGMSITLDGIAKGYVVDQGVKVLGHCGFTDVLVEAGGDLRVAGTYSDRETWRIGVAHPRLPHASALTTLALSNQAAATSGDYQNFFTADFRLNHIIDPRSGVSPLELASATAIAADAESADALSTALMVLGIDAGSQLISHFPGVKALLVTKDLKIQEI